MLGDLLAGSYAQASFPLIIQVPVTIPGTPGNPRLKIPPVPPQTVLVNQLIFPAIVSQPIVTRGAFKIAEDESPRPVDRVFAA